MRLDKLKLRILTLLAWRCRAASDIQLANALKTNTSRIRRACRELKQRELVFSRNLLAMEYQLTGPLVASESIGTVVDFGQIAWQMQRRWRDTVRVRTRVIWASKFATRVVGGVGGRLRPLQLEHDLGVAEVFSRRESRIAGNWISEDVFRAYWNVARRSKIPDAIIVDANDHVQRVIEFGGRYSRQRLEEFHRFWAGRVPYEIW